MRWDFGAEQQLLLAILAALEVKVDSEAVDSRLGEQCTPRAVVERLKKLKKQAKSQDDSASSGPMTKALPVKQKKVVPVDRTTSATHEADKPTQAQVSATSNTADNIGNDLGEAHLAGESSIRSTTAGDNVKGDSKSGNRLIPVKHTPAGISYVQSALDSGPLMLDERTQDKFHKVQVFSSSKVAQPFLDR